MYKKGIISLIVLVLSVASLFSQIPDGYYDSAEGKSGLELKAALYNIIKGNIQKTYGDSRYILNITDADTTNPDNVQVIYSNHSVPGAWDGGVTWNREHVWAKSRGFPNVTNSTHGVGSDLHNLRACVPNINSYRNNRWFGEGDTPYSYNGVPTGSSYSSDKYLWEPRDEDKGDVARIIFYMATRYEGENGEPDLEVIDSIPADKNTNDPVFAVLSDLIKWNDQDPPSNFEKHRNDVIYSYQKNRNPFIDHPEYVDEIWGKKDTTDITDTTAIHRILAVKTTLYPNPASTTVTLKTDKTVQNISVFNVIGNKVMDVPFGEKSFSVSDLPKGQYIVVMTSQDETTALPLIVIN